MPTDDSPLRSFSAEETPVDHHVVNDEVDNESNNPSVASGSSSSTKISGHSSSVDSSPSFGNQSISSSPIIARRESKQIFWLRIVLGVVVLAGASSAAFFIHKVTREGETEQFDSHFSDNAIKIIDTFRTRLTTTIAAIDNYAVISSTGASGTYEWPLVSTPRFEIRGASTRYLVGASLLSLLPLVTEDTRAEWEAFSINNASWIGDGVLFEETVNIGEQHEDHEHRWLQENTTELPDHHEVTENHGYHEEDPADFSQEIANTIYRLDPKDHEAVVDDTHGPFFPLWQTTPMRQDMIHMVNYNLLSHPSFGSDMLHALESIEIVFGKVADVSDIHDPFHFIYHSKLGETLSELDHEEGDDEHDVPFDDHKGDEEAGGSHDVQEQGNAPADFGDPSSMAFFPIFDHIDEPRNMVGMLTAVLYWSDFLTEALSPQAEPLLVVLENDCGQAFSYVVIGEAVQVLGTGDRHEHRFENDVLKFHFDEVAAVGRETLTFSRVNFNTVYCPYRLSVYPTTRMEQAFLTEAPRFYAIMIIVTFLFVSMIFFFYDFFVRLRQKKVARRAAETTAVVNSLFPANVRERLFKNTDNTVDGITKVRNPYLDADLAGNGQYQDLPIADLFPRATVLFADIAGFTAWSSSREPTQVFLLLETIYSKFDAIARRKRVFKVETIGDCYVAVTGVPRNQEDHVIRMVSFALSCLVKFTTVTKELESMLGPDTGSLQIRVGLHSGPVTAGVLRGEKSRFQLFGDTVNTASRMESTGISGRIQCSESSAMILKNIGKDLLLSKREDTVHAKGKGAIQTYWINEIHGSTTVDSVDSTGENGVNDGAQLGEMQGAEPKPRIERLIDWNVDVLHRQLKALVAARNLSERGAIGKCIKLESDGQGRCPIQDMQEVIVMPTSDAAVSSSMLNQGGEAEVNPLALEQLRDYVKTVASMYRHQNPFHNFDHSAHVTMSAQKLLSRILVPHRTVSYKTDRKEFLKKKNGSTALAYGLTSDPLTHFAILYSSLIHDVDHSGVSNGQLIQERAEIASIYKNQSVAEQNSIDIGWELLMESSYDELRKCIFTTQKEHDRFRSLVVNCVIATDIFDKELKSTRQKRWDKAFYAKHSNASGSWASLRELPPMKTDCPHTDADVDSTITTTNLKATIVIEHLIQASDVSHTMQHWHVYSKWNEKLFAELLKAYQEGRMDKHPGEGWYKGELWFFDNYVIPLAKKLFDCGVFGVSSDEYLQYAEENRKEWELKGADLVKGWVQKHESPLPPSS